MLWGGGGKHLLGDLRSHQRVEAGLRTSSNLGKAREIRLSLVRGPWWGAVNTRPRGTSLGDQVSVLSLKTFLLMGWLSLGHFWHPE